MDREEVRGLVGNLRRDGKKIVTCNGCFDVLHIGHIKFLEKAKAQGDVLFVGINSDEYIRQNKGPGRPVNNEEDRSRMLYALKMVDYVAVFYEDTPIPLLEAIRPDVHVNGSEYGRDCIEGEVVRKYGGRIHVVDLVPGYSSSDVIDRIRGD